MNDSDRTNPRIPAVSHRDRPDLLDRLGSVPESAFPEFYMHDPVWDECWPQMLERFPEHQIFLLDGDVPIAMCNGFPIRWDGTFDDLPTGTHDALKRAIREHEAGESPTAVCGIQTIVPDERKGKGLGVEAIAALKQSCVDAGLTRFFDPLRPTQKAQFPLIPINDYANWIRPDGEPFDYWLRVQKRLGGVLLGVSERSQTLTGTLEEWVGWTGIEIPGSGEYIIEGGLAPLRVDVDADLGTYFEPHIWVDLTEAKFP